MSDKKEEKQISSEGLADVRKNYYDKWSKFTKEEVEEYEKEEEESKQKAREDLGLNAPSSKAQVKDMNKHEALKAAKVWAE